MKCVVHFFSCCSNAIYLKQRRVRRRSFQRAGQPLDLIQALLGREVPDQIQQRVSLNITNLNAAKRKTDHNTSLSQSKFFDGYSLKSRSQ